MEYKPREERDTAASRGYDRNWRRFRETFLTRNPLCEYCKARGIIKAAEICDHDLPHNGDPALFWDNTFTALCKHHHDSTKQRLERSCSGDRLLQAVRVAKGLT